MKFSSFTIRWKNWPRRRLWSNLMKAEMTARRKIIFLFWIKWTNFVTPCVRSIHKRVELRHNVREVPVGCVCVGIWRLQFGNADTRIRKPGHWYSNMTEKEKKSARTMKGLLEILKTMMREALHKSWKRREHYASDPHAWKSRNRKIGERFMIRDDNEK